MEDQEQSRGSLFPGLALCSGIALLAFGLSRLQTQTPISPMMVAIVLALLIGAVFGAPKWARAGQAFAQRRLLRFAIVILGFQLTFADVGMLGLKAVVVILTVLALTFFFTRWIGGCMGVERGLSELIASGTAICGASAIVATNSVTRAPQEDVLYALASITFFGTIAMFAFPGLYGLLGLSPVEYGLWAGGSIHEVAQVVAAGFQPGPEEGETAMIAKLLRVAAMAPMILWLSASRAQKADGPAPPIPWFVLGFAAVILFNSALDPPVWFRQSAQLAAVFLLTVALAALGLSADVRKLRMKGPRPLALGAIATLSITFMMLAGIWLIR